MNRTSTWGRPLSLALLAVALLTTTLSSAPPVMARTGDGPFVCEVADATLTWTAPADADDDEVYRVRQQLNGGDVYLGSATGELSYTVPSNFGSYAVVAYVGGQRQVASCDAPGGTEPPPFECTVSATTLSWTDQGASRYAVRRVRDGVDSFVTATADTSVALGSPEGVFTVIARTRGVVLDTTSCGDTGPPAFTCAATETLEATSLSWTDQSVGTYYVRRALGGADSFVGPANGLGYAVTGRGEFSVIAYLDGLRLVAPCVLQVAASGWARRVDTVGAITVADDGAVYTSGSVRGGEDLDPSPTETFDLGARGAYVSRLSADGSFVWARLVAGSVGTGSAVVRSVSVDDDGNIYTVGSFTKTIDFDPDPDVEARLTAPGQFNATFISKLDANGEFVWVRRLADPQNAQGSAVPSALVLDDDGNLVIAGRFNFTIDFDPSRDGVFQIESSSSGAAFVVKLGADGDLMWARSFGGVPNDMAIDDAGRLVLAGDFSGTADFDPDPDATSDLVATGLIDAFVLSLSGDGDFGWAAQFTSNDRTKAAGVAVDEDGAVFVTGDQSGDTDFDPGPDPSVLTAPESHPLIFRTYVVKLDADGGFVWAGQMLSTANQGIDAIDTDAAGNVYASGTVGSALDVDLDPQQQAWLPAPGGFNGFSNFVAGWTGDGSLIGARSALEDGGTSAASSSSNLSVGAAGTIVLAGRFSGTFVSNPDGNPDLTATGINGYIWKVPGLLAPS